MIDEEESLPSQGHQKAIDAVAALLEKFKVDFAFVGQVAESVWLEAPIIKGSIDVLAVVGPDRRGQIPMMAMNQNRCFEVDREAVEAARELDLIPMSFNSDGRNIPIHILIASNALYSIMIRDSVEEKLGDRDVCVVRPEDLALLLVVDDSDESREKIGKLVENVGDRFDVEGFNARLDSLGLGARRISK